MDLTELPIELKANSKYTYLFNIIGHFSKFLTYPIENKESTTIYKYLKIALEYNCFQEEIDSDNGKEFKNTLFENYLKRKKF